MIEFLFASQNLPFTISLALMLTIALLEGAGMILGFGIFSLLDNLFPDMDFDIDIDAPQNPLVSFLGWMNFGRVPLLVIAVCFLTIFGLMGLIGQYLILKTLGFFAPLFIGVSTAFMASLPFTKGFTNVIHRYMPKDESSALSMESFIGKSATITLGTASLNSPAEAKLKDRYGQTHYFMVEPEDGSVKFNQGESVLLSKVNNHGFYAIKNDYQTLK